MNIKKSKNNHEIMLSKLTESDKLEVDTLLLMSKFLEQIEEMQQKRKITRKELAIRIGTSPSYLTQVFRGNRKLNFETLAKVQKELGIKFNITADIVSEENLVEIERPKIFISYHKELIANVASYQYAIDRARKMINLWQSFSKLGDVTDFARETARTAKGSLYRGKQVSAKVNS